MSTISPLPAATGRQLSLAELRDVVERYADDVRAGQYHAEFHTEERWHVRIHQDADVDVWLISWTMEQGTELHDHGGSSGAFTVVDGTLNEYVWSGASQGAPGRLVDNLRRDRQTIAFGPHYVHDVRNHLEAPAVSVHAYSPPIRLMHYYDAAEGSLLRWASSWTDDPEAPTPTREAS
ncbi:cysteine dioxygenase family protein [Nocardioides sp. CER19]|uniref:cysteine dioxygenase n=1 Tax=Nocardioides sp. CER19 TaxID=3038538 RepID=UPI002448AA6E|nr:cysteine dioxygenase family protein [Nocardioides sp. CER19]MDH2416300.1 cysteine dioxygenase family protein [Nocardioides sp. CER19]